MHPLVANAITQTQPSARNARAVRNLLNAPPGRNLRRFAPHSGNEKTGHRGMQLAVAPVGRRRAIAATGGRFYYGGDPGVKLRGRSDTGMRSSCATTCTSSRRNDASRLECAACRQARIRPPRASSPVRTLAGAAFRAAALDLGPFSGRARAPSARRKRGCGWRRRSARCAGSTPSWGTTSRRASTHFRTSFARRWTRSETPRRACPSRPSAASSCARSARASASPGSTRFRSAPPRSRRCTARGCATERWWRSRCATRS